MKVQVSDTTMFKRHSDACFQKNNLGLNQAMNSVLVKNTNTIGGNSLFTVIFYFLLVTLIG
jgi:hypothetical protein